MESRVPGRVLHAGTLLASGCLLQHQDHCCSQCTSNRTARNVHADGPHTKCTHVQVGSKPKVYIFHNFLTNAERTHMIRIAAPQVCCAAACCPASRS
jgi:hypothetical protein